MSKKSFEELLNTLNEGTSALDTNMKRTVYPALFLAPEDNALLHVRTKISLFQYKIIKIKF
jgi:hypothetical protein